MASPFVLTAQLALQGPKNTQQVLNQINRQLAGVKVAVSLAGTKKAVGDLSQINNQTKKVTKSVNGMSRSFAIATRRFAAFSVATRAVSLLTNRLSSAIDEAIKFQREMNKISQVTGKTASQLKGLEQAITSLSVSLGTSSTNLTNVARILSQAGFAANDLKTALSTLAKTTLAPTFDDITKTAEGAVAIFNQFNLGAAALEGQLGAINAVAGKFAVESGDLIGAVRRVGGVFKSAGGDLNELIALFTSVRSTTRESAESIATGIRTIFTRIQRPKTIEFMRQFGVELTKLDGTFVGPFEAARRLSAALGDLDQGDIRLVKVGEELAGFRQIGKVIPLIQQFSVAERARQEALAGAGSLDKDAATAQATLAIQIQKVKEEYLALVRSFADTSTFKSLVKITLGLATSFAKILESLKPLLPLIATFAAVKIGSGVAALVGSRLTRRATGGPVGLARGGVVPGSGSGDTVPAMLTPGEFVIKKSSVGKIGTGALSAMNSNRFAKGGLAKEKQVGIAVADQIPKGFQTNDNVTVGLGGEKGIEKGIINSRTGFGVLNGTTLLEKYTNFGKPNATLGKNSLNKISTADLREIATRSLGFPKSGIKPYQTRVGGFDPKDTKLFSNIADAEYKDFVQRAAIKFGGEVGVNNVPDLKFKGNITPGQKGLLFENTLNAFAGKPLDTKEDNRKPFDFTSGVKNTGRLFEELSGINYVDAKVSTGKGNSSIGKTEFQKKITNQLADDLATSGSFKFQITKANKKLIKDKGGNRDELVDEDRRKKKLSPLTRGTSNILSSIRGRAAGGGISSGSDTVPALLTPGEFVINKSAASKIGGGNLHKMNKGSVPGFAKGGFVGVQRFQDGGKATGGQAAGFDAFSKLFALQALPSIVDQFRTKTEGVRTSMDAVIDGLGAMVSTVASTGLALQAFGIQLNAKSLKQFFGSGKDGLGDVIGGFRSKAKGGRAKGESFTEGFNFPAQQSERISELRSLIKTGNRQEVDFGPNLPKRRRRFALKSLQGIQQNPLPARGTSLFARAGQFVGKQAGKKGLTGLAARGVGALATKGGIGLGAGLTGTLGALAGPATLVVAGLTTLSAGLTAAFGLQEKYNKAVADGNVSKAQELAVSKNLPGIFQGIAAAGSSIGFHGLAEKFQYLGSLFGGQTVESLQALAKTAALSAQVESNKAKNAKAASKALEDLAAGTINSTDALRSLTASFRDESKIIGSLKEQLAAKDSEKSEGFSAVARDIGSVLSNVVTLGFAGSDFAGTKNKRIEEEKGVLQKDINDRQIAARDSLVKDLAPARQSAILEGKTFEEFKNALVSDGEVTKEQLVNQGLDEKLKQAFDKQAKAIDENIAFLKSLNFGLRDVAAAAAAASSGMDRLLASQETGFVPLEQSVGILKESLTSTAVALNPRDVAAAQEDVRASLLKFGASGKEAEKAIDSLRGLNIAQISAQSALKKAGSQLASRGGTAEGLQGIKTEFISSLREDLEKANVSEATRKNVLASLEKIEFNDENVRQVLDSGNVTSLLGDLNNASQAATEQILAIPKEGIEQQKKLVELTKKKIQLEQQAIEAQKKSINIQLEAAEAIESLGGRKVTFGDKTGTEVAKLSLSLKNAGLSGLRSGSASEVAGAQRQLSQRFSSLNSLQGTGAFSGPEGLSIDKREQQKRAQEDIISYSRKRISQIKEELAIIQKKNALEKSSIESLLSGDIEGFFKQQGAATAASAIKSGDSSALRAVSASDRAAGLKSLEGQVSAEEFERLATPVLRNLGLTGRAAQVLSNNTPEEQGLRREGMDNAGNLANAGVSAANMMVEATNQMANTLTSAVEKLGNTKIQMQINPVEVVLKGLDFANLAANLKPFVENILKVATKNMRVNAGAGIDISHNIIPK